MVEEPRKEWELRMDDRRGPARGRGRRDPAQRGRAARRLHASVRSTCRSTGATGWPSPGANGSGKSTLLAALLGRVPLDEGTASLGPSVRIGEIDQARERFLGDEPLLDAFGAELPDRPTAEVRTLLAKFGLVADHVLRPAGTLSPGERTRAALALLQARGVNVLVLDEPTNHLDLAAIEQLEQALAVLRGHAAAGHARPPDARGRHRHPPDSGRRRTGHRDLTSLPALMAMSAGGTVGGRVRRTTAAEREGAHR